MERETKALAIVISFALFCFIFGIMFHYVISRERYIEESKCDNGLVNVKVVVDNQEGVWYETGALCDK